MSRSHNWPSCKISSKLRPIDLASVKEVAVEIRIVNPVLQVAKLEGLHLFLGDGDGGNLGGDGGCECVLMA